MNQACVNFSENPVTILLSPAPNVCTTIRDNVSQFTGSQILSEILDFRCLNLLEQNVAKVPNYTQCYIQIIAQHD